MNPWCNFCLILLTVVFSCWVSHLGTKPLRQFCVLCSHPFLPHQLLLSRPPHQVGNQVNSCTALLYPPSLLWFAWCVLQQNTSQGAMSANGFAHITGRNPAAKQMLEVQDAHFGSWSYIVYTLESEEERRNTHVCFQWNNWESRSLTILSMLHIFLLY